MKREEMVAPFWALLMVSDGEIDKSEALRIHELCVANDLDENLVIDTIGKFFDHQYDLDELAKKMDEDDKDFAFFGCFRVAFADGKMAADELQALHAIAEMFDWSHAYCTFTMIKLSRKEPDLKIEGLDY